VCERSLERLARERKLDRLGLIRRNKDWKILIACGENNRRDVFTVGSNTHADPRDFRRVCHTLSWASGYE